MKPPRLMDEECDAGEDGEDALPRHDRQSEGHGAEDRPGNDGGAAAEPLGFGGEEWPCDRPGEVRGRDGEAESSRSQPHPSPTGIWNMSKPARIALLVRMTMQPGTRAGASGAFCRVMRVPFAVPSIGPAVRGQFGICEAVVRRNATGGFSRWRLPRDPG
jgi:hypothetical protein